MIKLPPDVALDLPSLEQRYHSAIRGLMKRINSLYNAIVDRFGDDGLSLIQDISAAQGQKIGRSLLARGQATDIKSVGLFLVQVFENVRGEGEVTEFTDQRVAIKIYQCPYPFDRPEICRAHTTMEEQLVKTLNPNLDYTIEKNIPNGDDYCLHVLSFSESND